MQQTLHNNAEQFQSHNQTIASPQHGCIVTFLLSVSFRRLLNEKWTQTSAWQESVKGRVSKLRIFCFLERSSVFAVYFSFLSSFRSLSRLSESIDCAEALDPNSPYTTTTKQTSEGSHVFVPKNFCFTISRDSMSLLEQKTQRKCFKQLVTLQCSSSVH